MQERREEVGKDKNWRRDGADGGKEGGRGKKKLREEEKEGRTYIKLKDNGRHGE